MIKNKFAADTRLIMELETIKVSIEAIVNNIGNIIWALNPVNNTVENLLAYLRNGLQNMRQRIIEINIHSKPNEGTCLTLEVMI